MSSKSVDERVSNDTPIKEKSFNLKDFIISFSKFGSSGSSKYIYHGHETIPFKERHPAYQAILKHEFADAIRKFINKLR
ncbi:MAG: hypothetical protein HWN66_17775 [Candidatus Helarchaeota archaeon]|nr:hypothetical protein [Candidatus Helarchaeota archaeon]